MTCASNLHFRRTLQLHGMLSCCTLRMSQMYTVRTLICWRESHSLYLTIPTLYLFLFHFKRDWASSRSEFHYLTRSLKNCSDFFIKFIISVSKNFETVVFLLSFFSNLSPDHPKTAVIHCHFYARCKKIVRELQCFTITLNARCNKIVPELQCFTITLNAKRHEIV